MWLTLQYVLLCDNHSTDVFSLSLAVFPDDSDVSGQVEYPDDFEEAEMEEECDDEAALAPQQPHDDALEEEFQLCDAGGLTITLRALKEKG